MFIDRWKQCSWRHYLPIWLKRDCQRPKTVTVQQNSKQEQPAHTHCTDWNTHLSTFSPAPTHLHHLMLMHAQLHSRLSLSPWLGSRASFGPGWHRCWHEFGQAVTESHGERQEGGRWKWGGEGETGEWVVSPFCNSGSHKMSTVIVFIKIRNSTSLSHSGQICRSAGVWLKRVYEAVS